MMHGDYLSVRLVGGRLTNMLWLLSSHSVARDRYLLS